MECDVTKTIKRGGPWDVRAISVTTASLIQVRKLETFLLIETDAPGFAAACDLREFCRLVKRVARPRIKDDGQHHLYPVSSNSSDSASN